MLLYQIFVCDISGSHGDEYEEGVFWVVVPRSCSSEISVNFYQAAWRNKPGDRYIQVFLC